MRINDFLLIFRLYFIAEMTTLGNVSTTLPIEFFLKPAAGVRIGRVGVIPFAYNEKGQVVLLTGLKTSTFAFSDFGGGCKKHEVPFEALQREVQEESGGLFEYDITTSTSHMLAYRTRCTHEEDWWVEFLVQIAYDPRLPQRFNGGDGEHSRVEWINLLTYRGVVDATIKPFITTLRKLITEKIGSVVVNNMTHLFFWETSSPGSQWHKSPFTVDGDKYFCAEQYMMAGKARLFKDEEVRAEILKAKNARTIKELGRKVKNFDEAVWVAHRYDIVKRGNVAKFSQNEHLKKWLLETGTVQLIEAAPADKIYGIGLNAEDAARTPQEQWPGLNLLGKALMEVRAELGN